MPRCHWSHIPAHHVEVLQFEFEIADEWLAGTLTIAVSTLIIRKVLYVHYME